MPCLHNVAYLFYIKIINGNFFGIFRVQAINNLILFPGITCNFITIRIITATIPQLLIYFTIYNFLANEPINLTIFIPPLYSLPYQRDILVFLCLQDATAPYYRHGNQ